MSSDLTSSLGGLLNDACSDTANKVPGAILAVTNRKGELVFFDAAGIKQTGSSEKLDKNALCWMASCTKLITAIAVLQLVEQGKLNLDTPVHDVLPDIKKLEKSKPITLRHLLTHTAGMSYPFFNEDAKAYYEQNKLTSFGCKNAGLFAPLNAEPGERWEYGVSLDWAGLAVEKASGLDLDAYFKKNILSPLGIERITLKAQSGLPGGKGVADSLVGMNFRHNDKDGKLTAQSHVIEQDESKVEVQLGGAGAYGNAAEYVQILAALLNDGTGPKTGKQILTKASVEELFKDQLSDKLVKDLDRQVDAVQPEYTNAFTIPGETKQWALAGLKAYEGPQKQHSFVWWAGIANHFWVVNREQGFAAMIQSQIFPFGDPHVMPLFFGPIYQALAAAF